MNVNRIHRFVRRLQPNPPVALAIKLLDRGGRAVDESNHHLPVVGGVLLVDDDEIPVADLLVDHRVSANPQDEVVSTSPHQILGNSDRLGGLDRLDRHAGGNCAEERERGGPGEHIRRHELDTATLVVGALDVAFALEVGEMLMNRRERVIVKLRRDLLEARRVPVLFGIGLEVSENFPLAFCERHILFPRLV